MVRWMLTDYSGAEEGNLVAGSTPPIAIGAPVFTIRPVKLGTTHTVEGLACFRPQESHFHSAVYISWISQMLNSQDRPPEHDVAGSRLLDLKLLGVDQSTIRGKCSSSHGLSTAC